MNLKYNASKVDEIEQIKKQPIAGCIGSSAIADLCLFVQKGLIDDNGRHGVSKNVAMDAIDAYLVDHDTSELALDIMEALVNGGFLSRQMDMNKLREKMNNTVTEMAKQM